MKRFLLDKIHSMLETPMRTTKMQLQTDAQIELRELMTRANGTASPATSVSAEDHYATAVLAAGYRKSAK